MPDSLAIINRVIQEHQRIRASFKHVGESVSDVEALVGLQQAYSGWSNTSTEALTDKQRQLHETLGFLSDGLNNHFAFEERDLPPLLGELLTRALLVEHTDIRGKLGQVQALFAGKSTAQPGQEELLAQKSRMQVAINDLHQSVEEHASREEIMLNMMKKALEEKRES